MNFLFNFLCAKIVTSAIKIVLFFISSGFGITYLVPVYCLIMVALCNRADHYIFAL